MPKDVPITDEGYEDIDAFFSGEPAASTSRRGSSGTSKKGKATEMLSKAARREAKSKNDFAPNFELGQVGRRTGVKIRSDVPRTQAGYEDFDAFFKSPTSASAHGAPSSNGRGSARLSTTSSVGVGRRASVADTDYDKSRRASTFSFVDTEHNSDDDDEGALCRPLPCPWD